MKFIPRDDRRSFVAALLLFCFFSRPVSVSPPLRRITAGARGPDNRLLFRVFRSLRIPRGNSGARSLSRRVCFRRRRRRRRLLRAPRVPLFSIWNVLRLVKRSLRISMPPASRPLPLARLARLDLPGFIESTCVRSSLISRTFSLAAPAAVAADVPSSIGALRRPAPGCSPRPTGRRASFCSGESSRR